MAARFTSRPEAQRSAVEAVFAFRGSGVDSRGQKKKKGSEGRELQGVGGIFFPDTDAKTSRRFSNTHPPPPSALNCWLWSVVSAESIRFFGVLQGLTTCFLPLAFQSFGEYNLVTKSTKKRVQVHLSRWEIRHCSGEVVRPRLLRDNVVYWKTKRKIKNDLQLTACCSSLSLRPKYVQESWWCIYQGKIGDRQSPGKKHQRADWPPSQPGKEFSYTLGCNMPWCMSRRTVWRLTTQTIMKVSKCSMTWRIRCSWSLTSARMCIEYDGWTENKSMCIDWWEHIPRVSKLCVPLWRKAKRHHAHVHWSVIRNRMCGV